MKSTGIVTLVMLLILLPLYHAAKYFAMAPLLIPFTVYLYYSQRYSAIFVPYQLRWFAIAILYSCVIAFLWFDFNVAKSAISWMLFSILLFALVREYYSFERVGKFIILLSVFFSIDSIFQFANGSDLFGIALYGEGRVTGPFTWSSPVVGSFLMAMFFVPLLVGVKKEYAVTLGVLFLVVIALSGSRAALLQMFFVFFVFLPIKNKIFIFFTMFFVVYLMSYTSIFDEIAPIVRILKSIDYEWVIELEMSEGRRLHMWPSIIPILTLDYLLQGVGLGGLEKIIPEIYGYSGHIHPHNFYIEIFFSFGLIGTVLVLFSIFTVYRQSDRHSKMMLLSFWGPFNVMHSVFDYYWGFMLFLNLALVMMYNKNKIMKNSFSYHT